MGLARPLSVSVSRGLISSVCTVAFLSPLLSFSSTERDLCLQLSHLARQLILLTAHMEKYSTHDEKSGRIDEESADHQAKPIRRIMSAFPMLVFVVTKLAVTLAYYLDDKAHKEGIPTTFDSFFRDYPDRRVVWGLVVLFPTVCYGLYSCRERRAWLGAMALYWIIVVGYVGHRWWESMTREVVLSSVQ